MIWEFLKFLGSAFGMILKVILIIALCVGGIFSLGSALFYRFIWEGLIRLLAGLACAGGAYLIIRLSREKDEEPEDPRLQ